MMLYLQIQRVSQKPYYRVFQSGRQASETNNRSDKAETNEKFHIVYSA